MGHSFVKSCSWSAFYICVGGGGGGEREREFPLLCDVYRRAFFRSGLFVKLDFSILSKTKNKKKAWLLQDWLNLHWEEDEGGNNAKHNMVYIYGKHKLPPTHSYEKCRCDQVHIITGEFLTASDWLDGG